MSRGSIKGLAGVDMHICRHLSAWFEFGVRRLQACSGTSGINTFEKRWHTLEGSERLILLLRVGLWKYEDILYCTVVRVVGSELTMVRSWWAVFEGVMSRYSRHCQDRLFRVFIFGNLTKNVTSRIGSPIVLQCV